MKKLILLLGFVLLSLQIHAQKTAFINETELLKATQGYSEALESTEQVKKKYEEEINEARKKMQTKLNELLKNYNVKQETSIEQLESLLSIKDKSQYDLIKEENELLSKQVALKEKAYNALYQDKVGSILEKLNKITQEYCKKNKIDILYKKEALNGVIAYFENKLDVTQELIALIKK
jgi:Skp family chaperone for outer membrane proteins